MIDVPDDVFDAAVEEALQQIPDGLLSRLDNVVVLVEDEPTEEQLESAEPFWCEECGEEHADDLLGLYEGTPLTERGDYWGAGALPDRITIFRGPLKRMCEDREELVEEIAVTVVHEVAHHFGIEEDRLHELGWG
ncbi:metallopeptidase family protein [Buchananella felis]|uniref:metallopeptidase family protein n=1 Tax=Buchananella felis TaxID=3231492 RepID=UPI0035278858